MCWSDTFKDARHWHINAWGCSSQPARAEREATVHRLIPYWSWRVAESSLFKWLASSVLDRTESLR
jgi:hypothetical protein